MSMSNPSSHHLFTEPTQMATLNAASVIGGAEGASVGLCTLNPVYP